MRARLEMAEPHGLLVGVHSKPIARPLFTVRKSLTQNATQLLSTGIGQIQQWRSQGVESFFLDVDGPLAIADRTFKRYCDLGFDVFLNQFSLIRPEQNARLFMDEVEITFGCGWCFLPFLIPASSNLTYIDDGLKTLLRYLELLRPVVGEELRIVRKCWDHGIWHWSGLRGIPGLRSALRTIESENFHLMRLGLTRAQRGFSYGQDVFRVGLTRVLERRPQQIQAIDRMLFRAGVP